jgi:hypothetical protein
MAQPTHTNAETVEDAPESRGLNGFPVALLILLASPLTVISAISTYLLFSVGRIRISVIFWFGLIPYLVVLAFFWQDALAQFIVSWTYTIPAIVSQQKEILPGIIEVLTQQALISIPVGVIVGLLYSAYRWHTRPVWVDTVFRLTPKEWLKRKKNIKDIKQDKNNAYDGMTLGIDDRGERIIQTYRESVGHTLVFGAVGAGKTVTILARLRDAIKAGQGAVVIDLKGDPEFAEELGKLAKRYDRTFRHWLMQPLSEEYEGPALNGAAKYDPIGRGEATRRKDLLIESRTWTEEYYKNEASYYLQLVMSVIVANPRNDISTLSDVMELLNPVSLQKRAIPLGTNPIYADLIRNIDTLNDEKMEAGRKSAISSLSSQLGNLLNSVAGPWLSKDMSGTNEINLFRAAHEGEIVVFSLDSSNYEAQAALIANLIIQDLKTVSSELRKNPIDKPFQVVIDEFSAIGSENIVGLANKSRNANMPVTLTTQTLADLRKASPTLQDQLLGIVNSFIIHRANKIDDAEELAGLGGKIIKKRFNEKVVYKTGLFSKGSAVGEGSIEDVEAYAIDPTEVQGLETGEFFYINKNPMRIVHGRCIREEMDDENDTETKTKFIINPSLEITSNQNVTPVHEPMNAGQVSMPPSGGDFQLPVIPVVASREKLETPSSGIESRPANRDRLRNIMNQDPDVFSPKDTRKDNYEDKLMPPRIAPPLPRAKNNAGSNQMAPLPALPKPPVRAVNTGTNKPSTLPILPPKNPSGGLPTAVPILPSLTKPKVSEDQTSSNKDEFDF